MNTNTPYFYVFLALSAVAICVGAVIYVQPPNLVIESVDYLKKTGTFAFGGVTNTFGLNGGISVAAKNGYSLTVHSDGNSVNFDLYQNGVFLQTIKTITFLSF